MTVLKIINDSMYKTLKNRDAVKIKMDFAMVVIFVKT